MTFTGIINNIYMDLPILFIYGLNKVMKNYRLRLMVLLLLFTL